MKFVPLTVFTKEKTGLPECPAEAILPDTDDKAEKWTKLNEEFSEKWPNIVKGSASL